MGPPSDNLYIAELPAESDEESLRTVLGAYGAITSVKVLPCNKPGQKGAALVRLQNLAEAQWIVDNLNGNIPQGLTEPIIVRFADNPGGGKGKGDGGKGDWGKGGGGKGVAHYEPYGGGFGKGKAEGKGGKGGKGKGVGCDIRTLKMGIFKANILPGGNRQPEENSLFIGSLPPDTTSLDLYELFSPFGAIGQRGVKAMTSQTGECTGIGFVDFCDPLSAQTAIQTLNGTMMPDGSTLRISTKAPKKGGGKGEEQQQQQAY